VGGASQPRRAPAQHFGCLYDSRSVLGRGKAGVVPGALLLCALLLLSAPASGSTGPKCTIVGTAGPDSLQGKPGPDVICGRGGADEIVGGRGADRLLGGPGNDELTGNLGRDALLGGKGKDFCRDSRTTVFVSCERRSPSAKPPSGEASKPIPRTRSITHPVPPYMEPPDEEAPWAFWLSFQQRFVDTSAGDTTVAVYLEAWDPSGIGSISLRIDGPGGPWQHLELEGSSDPRSALEATIEVPSTTPVGDYRFSSLTISDRRGNTRALSAAEIKGAGYSSELAVFAGPDEEGPELTSLSLSTTEVDTSTGPASVDISVGAKDALSGVNDTYVAVVLPNWEPGPLELIGHMGSEVPPATGTRHDGVWTQRISLVQHAMPGNYKINAVYLSDLAGNTSHYKRQQLEELGFPLEFLQAGPGDTTPPEILDFWFEPSTLRTAAGNRTIFFYTHVRDDLSGFGQWPETGLSGVRTGFEPPGDWDEFSTSGTVPKLVSGSELDGIWREEVELEADSVPGEYEITYVGATDRAGNDLLLKRAEIESSGWPDSFINEP
jgi:hypothetical protein